MNNTLRFLVLAQVLVGLCIAGCRAERVIVTQPFINVWVNAEEKLGPYDYPLTLRRGAVSLYTQLFYGELFDTQEMVDGSLQTSNGFLKISVPGQLMFKRTTQTCLPLPGYISPVGFMKNDDLLALPPLVVTKEKMCVRKRRCAGSEAMLTLPFGSVLRASGTNVADSEYEVILHDGRVGYVAKDDVTMYTAEIPTMRLVRQKFDTYIRQFIGMPYNLGGRSMFNARDLMVLSSVDCSALVHVIYHVCGFLIPRIAHAQYLYSTPLDPVDMQTGDLIFFKRKKHDFERVSHVAMYLGDGTLIESTGSQDVEPNAVRRISVEDCFGLPLHKLTQGIEVLTDNPDQHTTIFFGTFFPTRDAAVDLREQFLALMHGNSV